jgi:hypothetical protein
MMRNWMMAVGAATMAISLYAVPASAAMPAEWDANADAKVTPEEFSSRLTSMGVFAKWDTDKNGMISQTEFNTGMTAQGEAFKTRFVGTADADLYTKWNVDGTEGLTEKEFYDGVYAAYDDDKDKVIEETEFSDITTDAGTLWKTN